MPTTFYYNTGVAPNMKIARNSFPRQGFLLALPWHLVSSQTFPVFSSWVVTSIITLDCGTHYSTSGDLHLVCHRCSDIVYRRQDD